MEQSQTTSIKPRVRKRRRSVPKVSKLKAEVRIEIVPIIELRPFKRNARVHSAKQIGQIKHSIMEFGFLNPIIVDGIGEIIAGHGRLMAAKELGATQVPVIRALHLNEAQIRAYRIADNKLALNAVWDDTLLRVELDELLELELSGEISFDIGVIGFETPELDVILDQGHSDVEGNDPADEITVAKGPVLSKCGDIWRLGRHKIYCGSSLEAGSYNVLMRDERAALLLTDPPYNVRVQGHVSGLGKARHEEFAQASGEMSPTEFEAFLAGFFSGALAVCGPGALIMTFMDWRHLMELGAAARSNDLTQINLCVWVKTNAGMGSLYRSQHELLAVYKQGKAPHINNVQLGRFGRYRTNVWTYSGGNSFGRGRDQDLADHPTVKPVAMIEDAIRDVTLAGDIVLDPFGGSGTTLLAAERCGRTARLIELEPKYVDVTLGRWEALTGQTAVEIGSGDTLEARLARLSTGVDMAGGQVDE